MHVKGDYAYLADYVPKQLYIYNVADKTSPYFVSSLTASSHNLHDIWYDDGYVYTATRGGGITMVNVTDPSAPVTTSTSYTGYTFKGLCTWRNSTDDYLFSGSQGIAVYHLKKLTGELGTPTFVNPTVGGDGREVVVTPDGKVAYRQTRNAGINTTLGIYNVENKDQRPLQIGTFHEGMNQEAPWEMEISPDGKYLYGVTVYDGFYIYDLTDTADPQLMSYTAHANIHDLSLDYAHNILYVRTFSARAGSDCSISAYVVSDPSSPLLKDCYYFPPSSFLNRDTGYVEPQNGDLWYSNGYIYAVYNDDLVILQVNSNVAPVAAISVDPLSGIEGSDMTFDASGSYDDNGDALTYSWDFDDGDTLSGNDAVVIHTFQDNGAFHVCVTVSDGTDDDTACLDVTVDNAAPSVGPILVSEVSLSVGDVVTVEATFTDSSSLDTHTAVWKWNDETTSDGVITASAGSGSVSGSHQYYTVGFFEVALTVMDDDEGVGESSSELISVSPVASLSAVSLPCVEGSAVTFNALDADVVNVGDLMYTWDFGDGTPVLTGSDAVVMHTFLDNGSFEVCVTVSYTSVSNGSLGSTFCLDATVENAAPSVDPVDVPVEMRLVSVGDTIEARASFTDPGSLDTHTGVFAWGDGETSDGVVTDTGGSGAVDGSHKYDTAGQYKVMLDVTDKDGDTGHSFFESVVVYDPDAGHLTGGG